MKRGYRDVILLNNPSQCDSFTSALDLFYCILQVLFRIRLASHLFTDLAKFWANLPHQNVCACVIVGVAFFSGLVSERGNRLLCQTVVVLLLGVVATCLPTSASRSFALRKKGKIPSKCSETPSLTLFLLHSKSWLPVGRHFSFE